VLRKSWQQLRAGYHRRRRVLRQAMLEPILVRWPTLRDVVMKALAARGHLVLCELENARFFVDPSDRVVGAWLMWHGGWQRREIEAAVELLSSAGRLPADPIFVDIGAHIGTHTVYALRTDRFVRAIAFEPEPGNARLLAMNVEANGLSQAVVVVHKAAGSKSASGTLHLHPRNTGAHAMEVPPAIDADRQLEVPVVRVEDELAALEIALEKIGLVWIDVEGYEPQVLAGLKALMARSIPITFEFTPHRYGAQIKEELVELLARHYTTVHSLGRAEGSAPIRSLAAREHTDDVLVY
jgi:FkbM family methyltransferase